VTVRRLVLGAGVIALFAVALMVFFPADAAVRWALARMTSPDGPQLVFRRAVLRPWGISVEEPALRHPDGTALLTLDWLRVRPALDGLVSGRSWTVRGGVCGGTGTAHISVDGPTTTLALEWHDLELATCPPLALTAGALAGHADGTATLALRATAAPDGEGSLGLRAARWQAGSGLGVDTLHADSASLHWALRDGRLTLSAIELHGPELEASGEGAVRLAGQLGNSAVDLRLAVAAGPAAPPVVRFAVATLPPSTADKGGPRSLVVTGTLDRPRVITP
jgi:type II secretion system protein N